MFWLRRESEKETHLEIPNCSNWKAFVLMVTGFCGGMLTAMFGTGLDLSVFSCLALFFRIHVNTAAPTGGKPCACVRALVHVCLTATFTLYQWSYR